MNLDETIQQLRFADQAERQRAARNLGLSGDERAGAALLAALDTERSKHVRWVIAAALGELAYTPAIGVLTQLLIDDETHHFTRYRAALAIQQILGLPVVSADSWDGLSEVFAVSRPDDPAVDYEQVPVVPEVPMTLMDLRSEVVVETIEVEFLPQLSTQAQEEQPPVVVARESRWESIAHYLSRVGAVFQRRRSSLVMERRLDQYMETMPLYSAVNRSAINGSSGLIPGWLLNELSAVMEKTNSEAGASLQQLIGRAASLDGSPADERAAVEQLFSTIMDNKDLPVSQTQRQRLFNAIIAEVIGLGPLEELMSDEMITEIMINGPKNVFIERRGLIERTNITFEDDQHVMRVLDRILAPLGRRLDDQHPMIDVRLPDGSRLNAVISPLSLSGPVVTIRRFPQHPLTVKDLIRFGSMTNEISEFLRACVIGRVNLAVIGGVGSGKVTLLNVLADFIPNDERIITIEHHAQFRLNQDHVVHLEVYQSDTARSFTYQELIANALLMRPDRLIYGEFQGGEAFSAIQAMASGHDGSLLNLHAISARDALSRLETMCRLANTPLPERVLRELIAAAVDLIVNQQRIRDGSRKIEKITEVVGIENDFIALADIFEFEQTAIESGKIIGRIRPTGIRPKFIDQIEMAGIHLPPSIFGIARRY
jgi:pilus assembly protein CpaF